MSQVSQHLLEMHIFGGDLTVQNALSVGSFTIDELTADVDGDLTGNVFADSIFQHFQKLKVNLLVWEQINHMMVKFYSKQPRK